MFGHVKWPHYYLWGQKHMYFRVYVTQFDLKSYILPFNDSQWPWRSMTVYDEPSSHYPYKTLGLWDYPFGHDPNRYTNLSIAAEIHIISFIICKVFFCLYFLYIHSLISLMNHVREKKFSYHINMLQCKCDNINTYSKNNEELILFYKFFYW